jgi:hypothetical protein
VENISIDKPLAGGARAMSALAAGVEIFVPFDAEKSGDEIARIRKKEIQTILDIHKSEDKLTDEKFVAKAPQAVVEKERAKLSEWRDSLKKLRDRLEFLGASAADAEFLKEFTRNALAARETLKNSLKEKGVRKARVAATLTPTGDDNDGKLGTLEAACEFMTALLGIECINIGEPPEGDRMTAADIIGFELVFTILPDKPENAAGAKNKK